MKSIRLVIGMSLVAASLFAQQAPQKMPPALRQSAIMINQAEFGPAYEQPGADAPRPLYPVHTNGPRTPNREVIIGTTTYDLQSNSSVCKRISEFGNKIAGTWSTSVQASGWADRGSGYNTYNGAS